MNEDIPNLENFCYCFRAVVNPVPLYATSYTSQITKGFKLEQTCSIGGVAGEAEESADIVKLYKI